MKTNLRHLRAFLAVFEQGSITRAAGLCHISQPAITQSINKLEGLAGEKLFRRSPQGIFPTEAGAVLATRVRRAFDLLDPALTDTAPRLRVTVTTAQLHALIAVREAENFTLAARAIGLAQPTVHRAITQLEQEAGRPLFERTSYGVIATRAAQGLAQAARLAFAELEQAEADLADLSGREVGRIVIGAMPLSRSYILPRAIARFRQRRPNLPIRALDGPYTDLMAGLRRGEVDFLVGALRDPAPIGDVEQRPLFDDALVMVARQGHPLATRGALARADLAAFPMVVSPQGTPTRQYFDQLFGAGTAPESLVETGSMILMRELLRETDHIGCISGLQIATELARSQLTVLPFDMPDSRRAIGLTVRTGWNPTRAQRDFIEDLQAVLVEGARDAGRIRTPATPGLPSGQ